MLVKDINPGRSPSVTEIHSNCGCTYNGGQLTNVRGTLYFSANDGKHGYELWRSDGTARGTRMVKDINPGAEWSALSGITAVNRIIYFTADDGVHGAELWRSDGTARGTRMVQDIRPGNQGSHPSYFADVNGTLYFSAFDGTNSGLWRSDGTAAGTTLVKEVGGTDLADVNGTLYFAGYDAGHTGLWRSDGTGAGTILVKGTSAPTRSPPSTASSTSARPTATSCGEATAPRPARAWSRTSIPPTPSARSTSLPPGRQGTLYFVASHGGPIPSELWRSDGTEAGTTMVRAIGGMFGFTAIKGTLYLTAGQGLWRRRHPARNDPRQGNRPGGYFGPQLLTTAKGTLYLVATDKRHGQEVWRSDGTRKGTRIVRDIRRGSASSEPTNLTAIGSTLFFTAKDGRHGRELWRAGPRPCRTAKGKCKKKG